MKKLLTLVLACLLVTDTTYSVIGDVWDCGAQWSKYSNPNVAWSYRSSAAGAYYGILLTVPVGGLWGFPPAWVLAPGR